MGKRSVQAAVAMVSVGGLLAVAVPGASAYTTPLPGDPPPGCGQETWANSSDKPTFSAPGNSFGALSRRTAFNR